MIQLFKFYYSGDEELYFFTIKKYGRNLDGWIYSEADDRGWVLDEGWNAALTDSLEVVKEIKGEVPKAHQLVGRVFNSKEHTISV